MIRPLTPLDAAALAAFLERHTDSSMFLRSNSQAAGLAYEGKPLQADYVAAFVGDQVVAVAAHCWNGMVLVQAPEQVAAVARAAIACSGRAVTGISGPAEQVMAARSALLEVRAQGVRRSVLFAERDDAKRAYRGLGFAVVGEYGLLLFDGG